MRKRRHWEDHVDAGTLSTATRIRPRRPENRSSILARVGFFSSAQSPTQWAQNDVSNRVKSAEAYNPPPSNTKNKIGGVLPSLPPYVLKSIINYAEGNLYLNGLHGTTTRLGIRHFASVNNINPLNPELNPICYLLALLGAHHFLHVSRIRVKSLTLRLPISYIYIYI